jgi:hypothetical protein
MRVKLKIFKQTSRFLGFGLFISGSVALGGGLRPPLTLVYA